MVKRRIVNMMPLLFVASMSFSGVPYAHAASEFVQIDARHGEAEAGDDQGVDARHGEAEAGDDRGVDARRGEAEAGDDQGVDG